MPHFESLACSARLRSTESQADLARDLCPACGSLLVPLDDLGGIVGYRAIETRGSTTHSDASGAAQLIADRVGEIIARRQFKHARVRLELESRAARAVSPQARASSSRVLGTGGEAVRLRRCAPTTAASRLSPAPRLFDAGVIDVNGAPPDESSHLALGGGPRSDVGPRLSDAG